MTSSGRTCLITGANTGLGLEVSKQLAGQGWVTIMVCRSKEKGERAMREVQQSAPDASIELMQCDLSSLKSTREFIDTFKSSHSSLDVLYNNAAVMKPDRTVTDDGFEMMFQVNYLASFVLANSLLDTLAKSASPLIVNNGRPSYKLRLDLDDLQFASGYKMYGSFFATKLCLLFSTFELARRQGSDGVPVTMIDPGPFKSDLVRDKPFIGWCKNLFSAPVGKAAGNLIHHLDPDDARSKNGKVFKEREEWPLSDYWKDESIAKRLWIATESMLDRKENSS